MKNSFSIPIDSFSYHANRLSQEELAWAKQILNETKEKYRNLDKLISDVFASVNLSEDGKENLILCIVISYCHVLSQMCPNLDEGHLKKEICKWLHWFLLPTVQQYQSYHGTHPVQFEPTVVVSLMTCDFILNEFSTWWALMNEDGEDNFLDTYGAEMINFARALRSSIYLFCMGDDVHATALFRGAYEVLAKIVLAGQFPEEYVLFKKFNVFLQMKKLNGVPIPDEMNHYLKQIPEYSNKNQENFLAYGWVKNSSGNRVSSMKEMLQQAFRSTENLETFFHISSEFIHEDYVGVGYDFPKIRKSLLDYYFNFCILVSQIVKEFFPKKQRKEIGYSKISDLQEKALQTFSGEIPFVD